MSDTLANAHPDARFDVVFHGEIIDGHELDNVKQGFIKLFSLSAEKVEQIFSAPRVVIKPNVDAALSKKFEQALRNVGAKVSLEQKNVEPVQNSVAEVEPLDSAPEGSVDNNVDALSEVDSNTTDVNLARTYQSLSEGVTSTWSADADQRDQMQMCSDDDADIYQAPEADLLNPTDTSEYGSLAKAEVGDFNASIGSILSEAWANVSGNKGTVWGAFGLYLLAAIVLSFGLNFIFAMVLGDDAGLLMLIPTLIQTFAILPLAAGMMLVCVKLSAGVPASAVEVFNYFPKLLNISITYLLMGIMVVIGFVLLVIPGIYLAVAYSLALVLVIDKDLSPWQALEASRKAISKCWFSVFGLWIVVGLICSVAMIPLGIGLIWALPLSMLCFGVLYRNIFGLGVEDYVDDVEVHNETEINNTVDAIVE